MGSSSSLWRRYTSPCHYTSRRSSLGLCLCCSSRSPHRACRCRDTRRRPGAHSYHRRTRYTSSRHRHRGCWRGPSSTASKSPRSRTGCRLHTDRRKPCCSRLRPHSSGSGTRSPVRNFRRSFSPRLRRTSPARRRRPRRSSSRLDRLVGTASRRSRCRHRLETDKGYTPHHKWRDPNHPRRRNRTGVNPQGTRRRGYRKRCPCRRILLGKLEGRPTTNIPTPVRR